MGHLASQERDGIGERWTPPVEVIPLPSWFLLLFPEIQRYEGAYLDDRGSFEDARYDASIRSHQRYTAYNNSSI